MPLGGSPRLRRHGYFCLSFFCAFYSYDNYGKMRGLIAMINLEQMIEVYSISKGCEFKKVMDLGTCSRVIVNGKTEYRLVIKLRDLVSAKYQGYLSGRNPVPSFANITCDSCGEEYTVTLRHALRLIYSEQVTNECKACAKANSILKDRSGEPSKTLPNLRQHMFSIFKPQGWVHGTNIDPSIKLPDIPAITIDDMVATNGLASWLSTHGFSTMAESIVENKAKSKQFKLVAVFPAMQDTSYRGYKYVALCATNQELHPIFIVEASDRVTFGKRYK